MGMKSQSLTLQNKSILVTGGAGFIGSHLVDRLIEEQPKDLIVVDNFFLGNELNLAQAKKSFPNLEIIRMDASNLPAMLDIVKRNRVEVIFDLATIPLPTSLNFPNSTVLTNVGIAATVCELARMELIESLVHLSSSETYGSASYVPMDEKHPHNASTPYAASKSSADHIIQSYIKTFNIDATIVKPFNNFGPRQNFGSYAGIIPTVIKNSIRNYPIEIFGDGEQTRDFMFVAQTADSIVKIYSEVDCHRNIWNLGSGVEISVNKLVNDILQVMGKQNHELIFTAPRVGDVRRHCADMSKIREKLNLKVDGVNIENLSQTIDWYTKNMS
jgi:UDP-glucose 4-epimerase